ncbi:hypothetical protein QAD02_000283 [Eretmocerus hayati]|uniref:Uncharacterized protein n=1 Tax=Eretmocerus hayati TaxID=131215 RepID=A0ACC2NCX1_9HYME|nr:hypothetical protein QAD02_000283 [Eretmocerus hayati]
MNIMSIPTGVTNCVDPMTGQELDEETCQEMCKDIWGYLSGSCKDGQCDCSDSVIPNQLPSSSPLTDKNQSSDDDSLENENHGSSYFNMRMAVVGHCAASHL